ASRSAKKRWLSARCSAVRTHSSKMAISAANASSKPMLRAFSMASIARCRALNPRKRRLVASRARGKISGVRRAGSMAPGGSPAGRPLGEDLPRKLERRLLEAAVGDAVDDAEPEGLLRPEDPRARNDVESGLESGDPGKALRPAAARDDAEPHFREGEDRCA